MRLGGSVPLFDFSPEGWIREATRIGYRAVTWPLGPDADAGAVQRCLRLAQESDVVIAEVGAWCNPLSPDDAERRKNIAYIKERLALAEDIGARCCVNVSGARGPVWDGGYAENYAPDVYALLVDTVREIIDAVHPTRTFYTLEPMPWAPPDGPDEYLRLIRDIDRPAFAVHLDFVNMLNSPRRFLHANAFVEECLLKLAPYTRSVHIKDAVMDAHALPCVIHECPPGQGMLDYRVILPLLHRHLEADMPVLLEHMDTTEAYETAFRHLSHLAEACGLPA